MSEVKHTAGPLHVVTSNSWPFDISICNAQDTVIDVMRLPAHSTTHKTFADALNFRGVYHSEADHCRAANLRALADAHLRAAAPELLEALQLIAPHIPGLIAIGWLSAEQTDSIRTIIAKATGAQQ